MTTEQKNAYDKLNRKLMYRGLNDSEWKQIVILRIINLIEMGENPHEWNKNQRVCRRKSMDGDVECGGNFGKWIKETTNKILNNQPL